MSATIPHPEVDNPNRIIPLEGGVNFRDVGGYTTADGRQTRWGQLYRSAKLTNLTDSDLAKLSTLGIQTIYDVRSDEEVAEDPDRVPDGAAVKHRPIVDPAHLSRVKLLATVVFRRNKIVPMFRESYSRIVLDGNAHIIGEMLTEMAQAEQRPLLYHCAAGKDRTGVITAILLELLGVPRTTILADYALSNQHIGYFMRSLRDNPHLRRLRIDPEDVKPTMMAEPINLQMMHNWLDDNYGSAHDYVLARTSMTAATIDQLRDTLLT